MSDQHFYCLRLICLTMAVLIHIGLQLIYGKKRDLLVMLCHMVTNIWVNIGLLPDGAKLNMLTHTCWHFFSPKSKFTKSAHQLHPQQVFTQTHFEIAITQITRQNVPRKYVHAAYGPWRASTEMTRNWEPEYREWWDYLELQSEFYIWSSLIAQANHRWLQTINR